MWLQKLLLYKKSKINLYNTFIYCIVFIFLPNFLFSSTVQKSVISPLNRLTVSFDKLPETVKSSLSPDKKTLTIDLGKVFFTADKELVASEGIIKQAVLQQKKGENTYLVLSLLEQRGYTIYKLPFSQNLVIEVFDWNKLNSVEESYRLGLLSLIDNENELAKNDLLNAAKDNNAEAASLLGFVLLSEGKINSALKNLRFAEINNTSINDNYAALAQVYNIKKNHIKAEEYSNLYKQKTGNSKYQDIKIDKIIETEENYTEVHPHIDSVVKSKDTDIDTTKTDTVATDTAQFHKILTKNDSTQKKESIWTTENWLLTKYAVGIVIAILMAIVYFYLKWRNKKILAMNAKIQEDELKTKSQKTTKNIPKPAPKNEFDTVIEKQKLQIAKDKVADKKQKDKNSTQKKTNDILNLINTIKATEVIKSDSVLKTEATIANQKALEAVNNMVKNTTAEDIKDNVVDTNVLQNIQKKRSANVELADRLAKEQKRIKNEKLSELNNTLEIDTTKIEGMAQKLGIERSTIETKQNLENLASNTEEFNKLSEKFGVKK